MQTYTAYNGLGRAKKQEVINVLTLDKHAIQVDSSCGISVSFQLMKDFKNRMLSKAVRICA